MKIITPQATQTGEVRLLSKLLNQKVDTVRCMCSRGKTLTVQGLWVCKKTGSLVEMHPQALELLTFRYAYKTVLNQSKQKPGGMGWFKQCCVDGRSHPHFYSLIYNSCTLLPDPFSLLGSGRETKNRTKKKTEERRTKPLGQCTSSIWPSLGTDHQADCLWQISDTFWTGFELIWADSWWLE